MQETQVQSLGWEDPLEKGMATHSGILAGKSHGERSLVGYNPRGHKELETTKRLTPSPPTSYGILYYTLIIATLAQKRLQFIQTRSSKRI